MNKKIVYESIMNAVSKEVKKALNENTEYCNIDEVFDDYETDCLDVSDLCFSYRGISITHVVRDNGQLTFWSGNPEIDDNAEEVVLPDSARLTRFKFIDDICNYL